MLKHVFLYLIILSKTSLKDVYCTLNTSVLNLTSKKTLIIFTPLSKKIRVLLTSVLKKLVKDSKIETIDNFYVEKFTF